MPTYQYACTSCGEQLEVVQSFSDPALTVCPECQGKLRKLFSGVGIVFKGSGFYRTDSRAGSGTNGSNGAAAKETSAPKQDSGTKDSGTKDSGSKDSGTKKESSAAAKPAAASASSS